MKPARIYSAQTVGLVSRIVTVEVDLFRGLHTFSVVGLPDKAVEESRDRVNSAVKSAGFESPKTHAQEKVVVSLAPADLKKEGPLFDLPIALAYLLASKSIQFDSNERIFLGELSLSGDLQPLRGALLLAKHAQEKGFKEIYLPAVNAEEAALIDGIAVFGVNSLEEIIGHLDGGRITSQKKEPVKKTLLQQKQTPFFHEPRTESIDFGDIRGQETAKRGLEIAAAGGHNIAFWGPPGTGKTLLAKSFISILPSLTFEEALEVTGIHSITGTLKSHLITEPPFRAPHHTSSHISIVGGGAIPKPGEITLAHRGVLFLDEFPEFDRRVIESLRQPLEDGTVSISRARGSEIFPAEFILIAALNPCPCGYFGDKTRECTCTPSLLQKYRRKISGPIIDRIDMWIEVPRIEHAKLSQKNEPGEESPLIRERVTAARALQQKRFESNKRKIYLNSRMGVKEIQSIISLEEGTTKMLDEAAKKLDLSARAYHRILKLSRTIADLDNSKEIKDKHILEAIQYRPKTTLS